MIITLVAALAATTPQAKFDVTEWRLTSARNAWLECVMQDSAHIRSSSSGDPMTPEVLVGFAELECWVMRYAVRDALPDAVRANLVAQGIRSPQRNVVDMLAESAFKIAEDDMRKQAILSVK